jgi:hypothetical protein
VAYIENVLYEHPDLADVAVASGRGIAVMLETA